ncbi:TBC1 domain family member 12 isoform X3 [Brienomyrus brachyistius]|uniref:TBC1 domain family member 12 isoform X3 n=1 Tax=Brienomyrus brachyistius TaxID=42636 RepID=UPI0020B433AB|nr:TBC1 domain family member 12 isoform X3 [Brienomyrus brachyistius]
MEEAAHGVPLPPLSVDVNENEEIADCDAAVPGSVKVSGSRVCKKPDGSTAAGERDASAAPAGPSRCGRVGDGKMLGFITECLPGIKDGCGGSERREDAALNGFGEKSGGVVAGSGGRGGGTEGALTWPGNPRRGEVNGMLPDGVSPGAGRWSGGRFHPDTAPRSSVPRSASCDGSGGRNVCTAGADPRRGLLWGIADRPDGAPNGLGGEGKVANGGMLIAEGETDPRRAAADGNPRRLNEETQSSSPASCGSRRSGSDEEEASEASHRTLRGKAEEPSRLGPDPPCLSLSEDGAAKIPRRPCTLRTNPKGTVSRSCDATPLSPSGDSIFTDPAAQLEPGYQTPRNTFEGSRRQSAPEGIPDGLGGAEDPASDQVLKQKRYGISEFFGRGLFSKKPKEPLQSAPGWKLFGRVPPRENPQKDSRTIQQDGNASSLTSVSTPNLLSAGEYEARTGKMVAASVQPAHGRRKNLEFEPLSTTALILEDRPANLPAKSAEEAQRHRQEYDEMVAEAKRREMKEAQRKKKLMKERFRQEESIANAMVTWNSEILPNWESIRRHTRKVRELWWQGLPPSVRGRVWSLAIGNELNITPELYEIFLSRAKEKWRSFSETSSESEADDSAASQADRESSLDLIKLDISRTFPSLFIFQKGGPYHDLLHSVLGAYTCYRPDVGYVQGMSFIAAVLILNLEEADAFIAFANLLNKPCQMAFFRVDHDLMLKYFAAFEVFFEENLPRLFSHFNSYKLTPDLYLIDWIFTLYSKSLPLDLACRVWDVFCRDSEEFLFRTALGILRLYEEVLLHMDFIHIAQFLTRLPEDIAPDRLFGCIAAVQMLSGNRKWAQVFSALMKDGKDVDKNNSPALKS